MKNFIQSKKLKNAVNIIQNVNRIKGNDQNESNFGKKNSDQMMTYEKFIENLSDQNEPIVCMKHQQEFVAFCSTSKQLICVNCIIENPKKFDAIKLDEAMLKEKEDLKNTIKLIKPLEQKLIQQSEILTQSRKEFTQVGLQTLEEIRDFFEKVKNRINQAEQEIIDYWKGSFVEEESELSYQEQKNQFYVMRMQDIQRQQPIINIYCQKYVIFLRQQMIICNEKYKIFQLHLNRKVYTEKETLSHQEGIAILYLAQKKQYLLDMIQNDSQNKFKEPHIPEFNPDKVLTALFRRQRSLFGLDNKKDTNTTSSSRINESKQSSTGYLKDHQLTLEHLDLIMSGTYLQKKVNSNGYVKYSPKKSPEKKKLTKAANILTSIVGNILEHDQDQPKNVDLNQSLQLLKQLQSKDKNQAAKNKEVDDLINQILTKQNQLEPLQSQQYQRNDSLIYQNNLSKQFISQNLLNRSERLSYNYDSNNQQQISQSSEYRSKERQNKDNKKAKIFMLVVDIMLLRQLMSFNINLIFILNTLQSKIYQDFFLFTITYF